MKLIIKEESNMVEPNKVKNNLLQLNLDKITNTKTNYNLLVDINDAARNSNQKVTIINSDGTTVGLNFSMIETDNVQTFTTKLQEKGYVSGGTGVKSYNWVQGSYTVTNKDDKQSSNPNTTSTTKSDKTDEKSKEANELIKSIMSPMVSSVVGNATNESIMEDIKRIKKLINL